MDTFFSSSIMKERGVSGSRPIIANLVPMHLQGAFLLVVCPFTLHLCDELFLMNDRRFKRYPKALSKLLLLYRDPYSLDPRQTNRSNVRPKSDLIQLGNDKTGTFGPSRLCSSTTFPLSCTANNLFRSKFPVRVTKLVS